MADQEYQVRFFGQSGQENIGTEMVVNKHFMWDEEEWYLPSIYTCGKGLVLEFFLKVPPMKIKAFIEKYHIDYNSSREVFSIEQQQQIDADNPLIADILPKVVLNGLELKSVGGTSDSWIPLFPDRIMEIKGAMQHYGLDPEYGWLRHQRSFLWNTEAPSGLDSMTVLLERQKTAIAGPHFTGNAIGDGVEFIHPVTGVRHTLTVQEIENQAIDKSHFPRQNMEFPTNCRAMSFTLSPDLPQECFQVQDTISSDRPRQKKTDSAKLSAAGASVIIGGSYGLTSVALLQSGKDGLHSACSSLYFELVENVEWRITFFEKLKEDIRIDVI